MHTHPSHHFPLPYTYSQHFTPPLQKKTTYIHAELIVAAGDRPEGHTTLLPSQIRTRTSQAQIIKYVLSCEELMKWSQDVLRLTKEV